MPQDPVVALLLKSPLTPSQRRSASEAFTSARDEDDLQDKMLALNLPKAIRADLWDMKASAVPISEEQSPAGPEGSALGRFASNAGEMINPVAIAKGLYNAGRHPFATGSAIVSQSGDQLSKAKQMYDEGRYSEAAGHLGGAIPVIGPIAAEAGEQIASGDVAGGLGKAVGILAPFGAAEGLARGTARAARAVPAVAPALERGAAARVAEVMAPKSSTQMGRRMGAKAAKIAPELLERGNVGGWSRAGLQATIGERLANASEGLDAATDARLAARTHETAPVVDALKQKLDAQSVKAVEASDLKPVVTGVEKTAQPLGQDVIPRPNQPRAGQIQQAIKEVEQLGPVAMYDSLKSLRQAYDQAAQTVYNPSVTADYLKVVGEAKGAADVTGAVRDYLAKLDPATASANLDYSLYKSSSDILKATEEIEKARPKVGRQIMARLTGSLVGGQQAGAVGAVAGFALGPLVEQALSAGFTTKLQTAKFMHDLSKAITKGDVGRVTSLSFKARQLVKQAEATRSRGAASLQPNTQGAQ